MDLTDLENKILGVGSGQRHMDWYGNVIGGEVTSEELDSGECAWPELALTMVGRRKLINIKELCVSVESESVPGHWIECGVWRGGACIYARACLGPERKVYVCDSFCGFPKDEPEQHWTTYSVLNVSLEQVRANFEKFRLNENVVFVPGYFKDTLPTLEGPFSIIRLDGDSHRNYTDCITSLWPKLSKGGYLIMDDFGLPQMSSLVAKLIPESSPITVDRMCSFIKK